MGLFVVTLNRVIVHGPSWFQKHSVILFFFSVIPALYYSCLWMEIESLKKLSAFRAIEVAYLKVNRVSFLFFFLLVSTFQ